MLRRFENIDHALACADNGGQALFITGWIQRGSTSVESAAHLFDADLERLKATAKRLQDGIDVLTPMQWRPGWLVYYIPLASVAVERALKQCHSRIVRRTVQDGTQL